jgi:hypothetical protein
VMFPAFPWPLLFAVMVEPFLTNTPSLPVSTIGPPEPKPELLVLTVPWSMVRFFAVIAICPAGAPPAESVLILGLFVTAIVSAVIVMLAGRVPAVPPKTAVLTSVLLSAISLAGSVEPGDTPDMVTVPPWPDVLSVPAPTLAIRDGG